MKKAVKWKPLKAFTCGEKKRKSLSAEIFLQYNKLKRCHPMGKLVEPRYELGSHDEHLGVFQMRNLFTPHYPQSTTQAAVHTQNCFYTRRHFLASSYYFFLGNKLIFLHISEPIIRISPSQSELYFLPHVCLCLYINWNSCSSPVCTLEGQMT